MSKVTVTTWTCDKDGATATGDALPPGWATITVNETIEPPPAPEGGPPSIPMSTSSTITLCPTCAVPAVRSVKP